MAPPGMMIIIVVLHIEFYILVWDGVEKHARMDIF